MKRVLCFASAVALLLGAFSCTREEIVPIQQGGNEVDATFTVTLASSAATKAMSDGTTVDELLVGIYDKDGVYISEDKATVSNKVGTFNTKLVNGGTYQIVFWAQKSGTGYYAVDFPNKKMTVSNLSSLANDETRDAFFANETVLVTASTGQDTYINKEIVLRRPFAQVNVLAPNEDIAAAKAVGIEFASSSMTLQKVPTTLDLFAGTVADPKDIEFKDAPVTESAAHGNYANTHQRILTNYVLAGENTVDVTFVVNSKEGTAAKDPIPFALTNVPIKKNYRTNIIGDVFRVDAQFTVTINPEFEGEQEYDPNAEVPDNPDDPDNPTEESGDYVKVTEAPADWAGTYLIVYEGDGTDPVAFNTGLETIDAVENGISVTIVDNTIASNETVDAAAVTIEAIDGGYAIKAANGLYFGQESDANGLKAGETPYVNTISLEEDGAGIVSADAHLRYNSASNQLRFRYYKSTSYANQKPIQLYKKGAGSSTTDPDEPTVDPNVATNVAGIVAQISTESTGADTASDYTAEFTTNNAVVSYVNGSNVYIEDASGAILLYMRDSGLSAGDKITGKLSGKGYWYRGLPEITSVGEEMVSSAGGTIPETVMTIAELTADYTANLSRRIKVEGITVTDGIADGDRNGKVKQGDNEIAVYANLNNQGLVLEADATGDLICFPGIYSTTQQLIFWDNSFFTASTGGDDNPTVDDETTISQIIALEDNATCEITAVVGALSSRGYVLTDGTDAIFVYESANKPALGDKVKVAGTKTTYNGVPEITTPTAFETISTGNAISYPAIVDITSSVENYSASTAQYIMFEGTLSISGNYYNVAFDGVDTATKQGSIYYPHESLGASAYDGQKIKVVGYFNGLSGGGRFVNIIATAIETSGTTGGDDNPGGGDDNPGSGTTVASVSEIITAEVGSTVTFGGLVSGLTSRGYVVTDGTNAIYVYETANTPAIGDEVEITGTMKSYSGIIEIDPVSEFKTVSTGNAITYPTPKDVTLIATDYSSTTSEFISLKGKLIKSGNYYNVEIDGVDTATKMGSVSSPHSSLGADSYVDKTVTITGYFGGLTGSGRYLNILTTKIEVVQ